MFTDDVRSGSRQQQKRLHDLKKEYEDIEKKCKTKIIDDLASLYYKEPMRSRVSDQEDHKHENNKKKVIKSRSINIEILEDGSVKTSKIVKSNSNQAQVMDDDDESLDKSITISINSKSSRRSQKSCNNSANRAAAKTHQNVKRSVQVQKEVTENDDDSDDECDTLNAIENISVHDDLTESNSKLHQENTNIRSENEALKKKYRKYKTLKTKFAQTNAETEKYKQDIETLKLDLGRMIKENTELRLAQSTNIHPDSESRRLQRQNSIYEAPVRDSQDQAVQVAGNLDGDKGSFSSLEVDYFTGVIIDELKREIGELKNQVNQNHQGGAFKAKEETILGKLSKMKIETEKLKTEASKSQEESFDSNELEKLKLEVVNLKKMLVQQQETSDTYESYIALLKSSYTSMFGHMD